jgi:hypothetical protein
MDVSLRARVVAAILSVGTTFALVALIATYAYPEVQSNSELAQAIAPS